MNNWSSIMKRRDFLVGTIGVAGAVMSPALFADIDPGGVEVVVPVGIKTKTQMQFYCVKMNDVVTNATIIQIENVVIDNTAMLTEVYESDGFYRWLDSDLREIMPDKDFRNTNA